jgi:hypothetical protein
MDDAIANYNGSKESAKTLNEAIITEGFETFIKCLVKLEDKDEVDHVFQTFYNEAEYFEQFNGMEDFVRHHGTEMMIRYLYSEY